MGIFDRLRREKRTTVTQSADAQDFYAAMGIEWPGISGMPVTVESALGVPAVAAAVNFYAGTIAGLPLHVYEKTDGGREKSKRPLARILHDAVSDEMTSFEWRRYTVTQLLTGGRGVSQIVRNGRGEVREIVPWEPAKTTIERRGGRKFYGNSDLDLELSAADIIDLPYMLKANGYGHFSPITLHKKTIGLAQAVEHYAASYFENGGVPPFVVQGGFQTPQAVRRASDDMAAALKKTSAEKRQFLALPAGLEIKSVGGNAEQNQLLETQRFMIEQIARIYNLPPTFLQDLTHGTYSNTEQQDLHVTKHSLKRWVELIEQELNLKLFGRSGSKIYVEFSMDGLLRGDFKTRMDGYGSAVSHAIMTPAEVRAKENLPVRDGADQLMIQGATVPIAQQSNEAENED